MLLLLLLLLLLLFSQILNLHPHIIIVILFYDYVLIKRKDFRGPQGVWTLRSKGQMAKAKNLTQASPTYSHYAITELAKRKLIKFIVTTNMDSLHLRTGLPKHFISEQHGNWFFFFL